MSHWVKKLTLVSVLVALLPATIVCDVPGLDEVFDELDFYVYDDGCHYDDCCDDCWSRCDDWFFDFDCWW